MRTALALLLLTAACHRAEPTTMIHGSVVDHQRVPVKQFQSREMCEIQKGMWFDHTVGVTRYYACEKTKPDHSRQ